MAKKKAQLNSEAADALKGLFVDSIEVLRKILEFDEDDCRVQKIGNLVPRALLTERFKAKKEVALAIVNSLLLNVENPVDPQEDAKNSLKQIENALKQLAAHSQQGENPQRDNDNGQSTDGDSSTGATVIQG